MISAINQHTRTKITTSTCKLIHSLSKSQTSSFSKPRNDQNPTLFDPISSFTLYTKSKHYALKPTKTLHAQLLKSHLLLSSTFISNTLVDCYCKCSAFEYALKLFDEIPRPNVISWNIVISGCNQLELYCNSWIQFCRMHRLGFEPNEITYGSVLSACTALEVSFNGMQIYSLTLRNGFFPNGFVRTGMIDLFAKNYLFDDALKVFTDVLCENVASWNAIIAGAVKNGENLLALNLFQQMCRQGFVLPNSFTFSSVLTACRMIDDVDIGKGIQGWVVKFASNDVFVGTSLMDLFAKWRDMDGAMKVFRRMPFRNVVSWTAIISGFVQEEDIVSAINLFKEMRRLGEEINNFTVTTILNACGKCLSTELAAQIHAWLIRIGLERDPVVGAALITVYSRLSAFDLSELVFRDLGNEMNAKILTSIVSACAQSNDAGRVVQFFRQMLQEGIRLDKFCASSLLSVADTLNLGRQVHSYVIKGGLVFEVSVGSALFVMYSKCGRLSESYKIFKEMGEKDIIAWSSMIAGFAEHDYADEALDLFRKMSYERIMPDQMTFKAILTAISAPYLVKRGKEIHANALRLGFGDEIIVGCALVAMYSKCGMMEPARRVFNMMSQRDDVAFSLLISGYCQQGCIEEAVLLFHEMMVADLGIDSFTISSLLGAVALVSGSSLGMQLHSFSIKAGLDSNASVGSSLVTMYSKFGSLNDFVMAFTQIKEPDLIGWTAIISSYAQHGKGDEALRAFELMKREKIKPDPVTFVGVLAGCSHSGLVDEGFFHFNSMTRNYGIQPGYQHFACMVDLLGRSGRLKEAEKFINDMPIQPNALIWGTLLAACKLHGDIELGRFAARKVEELDPHDAGAYISISNIFANMGQWGEVFDIRNFMQGTGAKKQPGWSAM